MKASMSSARMSGNAASKAAWSQSHQAKSCSAVACAGVKWSEPLGLDRRVPSELSRFAGELGFEFLGGSVSEGGV